MRLLFNRTELHRLRFVWICNLTCVFLVMTTRVWAQEVETASNSSTNTNSNRIDAQVQSLTSSQLELKEQLNRVLRQNEQLTRRLNALQHSAPAVPMSEDPGTVFNERLNGPEDEYTATEPGIGEIDTVLSMPLNGADTAVNRTELLPQSSAGMAGPAPCDDYGLKTLFDSLHQPSSGKSKPWYEKLSIRGYSQFRFGRALTRDSDGADPHLFGDHSISANTGTFSIRRARLAISGDVSDHLSFFFQSDFANNPADGTNTYFAQIRDLYADIYFDTEKVHRVRLGESKIPWGFEEMQSSGNRIPLDRSDAIDSGDSPNQRDLGAFYYWTPEDKQKLLKQLVDGGLKGSGNYGIFGIGVYNGQGGLQLDQNRNLHTVARFTWPFELPSGQIVETSIQGYIGKKVVDGASIRPQGQAVIVPTGVGGEGLREQRIAGTFVWYPQPLGFQSEWNVGEGPGLNDAQTAVKVRSLSGGYVMAMYKVDTSTNGIFIPYARYQQYKGGYRSIANAPYGIHDEYDLGVEWQIRRDLELVVEYNFVNGVNLEAVNEPGETSYRNFRGQIMRCQVQVNY